MRDVAIIGSGPAGLSASLYTTRAGLSTVVYTGETRGGLPTTTEKVDNYLGMPGIDGAAMADVFLAHALELGAIFDSTVVTSIRQLPDETFIVEDSSGNSVAYRSVIFAAGSKPRKLEIPGEDLVGVSSCATCDGSFSKGEEVAVIGGGESAVEEAIYMSNLASKVTVIVRGEDFKANRPAVENLLIRPNVSVLYETIVEEVLGDDAVEGIKLSNGDILPVYSIFEAIGQVPQSAVAAAHSEIYSDGFIKHSVAEGFFIAGDISNPEHRQIAVAVGDGAKAAMNSIKWLQLR